MKKIITLFLLVFGILLFQNAKCYSMGLFYTDANYPVTATGVKVNNLSELKEGKSEAINVLWVVEVLVMPELTKLQKTEILKR